MAKRKHPTPLSKGQAEIMEIVWDGDEMSVTDVWREMNKNRDVARNTIQTVLLRLEEKGWLKHRVDGRRFMYSATHPRVAARTQMIRRLVDTVFDGSTDGLVMALLQERGITDESAKRIRQMIEEAGNKGNY